MEERFKNVLVVHASRLGSTAETAAFIADLLTIEGVSVVVKAVDEVSAPSDFDLVIIGSAIRYDRWLPEAVEFVRSHQSVLGQRKLAYFFTCLTLAERTEATERKAAQYAEKLERLVPELSPISIGRFGGVLNFARAPWVTRALLRLLSFSTGLKEGDYRDWNQISEWAKALRG